MEQQVAALAAEARQQDSALASALMGSAALRWVWLAWLA